MPIATADSSLDDAIAEFARLRPRLLGIASRIVGSWTEAEDVVQDAWLRWQLYDRTVVQNPTAFLVTTTTRLAMNVAQSARTRHETAVGRGFPELVDAPTPPYRDSSGAKRWRLGIRVLLQRLSPTERAAYVLRQAFDYPYPQIAEVLQVTEANARQLVSRSSKRIAGAVETAYRRQERSWPRRSQRSPSSTGRLPIRQLEPSHRAVASSRHCTRRDPPSALQRHRCHRQPAAQPRRRSRVCKRRASLDQGPIVLVARWSGGMVITEAAAGNDAVAALVYVATFTPDHGESAFSCR